MFHDAYVIHLTLMSMSTFVYTAASKVVIIPRAASYHLEWLVDTSIVCNKVGADV